MKSANIYLTFNGNCEAAFNFYKSVIGGQFTYMGKFKDMPPQEGIPPVSETDAEKIMHVSLPVGDHSILMGSDTGGEWAPAFQAGNNFSISLNVESKDEADRLFEGLSKSGNVTMPMGPTFWGDYFGMFTDQFGINWMISFNEGQK